MLDNMIVMHWPPTARQLRQFHTDADNHLQQCFSITLWRRAARHVKLVDSPLCPLLRPYFSGRARPQSSPQEGHVFKLSNCSKITHGKVVSPWGIVGPLSSRDLLQSFELSLLSNLIEICILPCSATGTIKADLEQKQTLVATSMVHISLTGIQLAGYGRDS